MKQTCVLRCCIFGVFSCYCTRRCSESPWQHFILLHAMWSVSAAGGGWAISDKYFVARRSVLAYIRFLSCFSNGCQLLSETWETCSENRSMDVLRRVEKKITSVCFYLPCLINYAWPSGLQPGACEWVHVAHTHKHTHSHSYSSYILNWEVSNSSIMRFR